MHIATQSEIDSLLLQAALLEHVPATLLVFLLGCCVGSFLNVVIYRLPRQRALLTPPSSCPTCGHKLRFFRENLPIIGWLAIGGKCRYCKSPVSKEYPIVEAITGLLFLLMYVLCYWVSMKTTFFGEIFGSWWHVNGVVGSLPMFIALLTMVAGILAMTVIDARTFTIPIQIPIVMTVAGVLAGGIQGLMLMRHTPNQIWPLPSIDWTWASGAFGGMFGVLISCALLKMGVFKYSFADYEEYIEEGEVLAQYPHARREMGKEILFIIPICVCFVIGWMVGYEKGMPSMFVQGIGGSMLGYLVGGGLVWGIRILGTLGFGREAMGLGDVHLLAGIGAILGWWDPILIFFIAPFSGLIFAACTTLLAKIGKKHREIPYGPHLAVATLVVVLGRPAVHWVWSIAMPTISMPTTPNLQTENLDVDLTNTIKSVSIHITPVAVGYGKARQDVSLTGVSSSDTEKGRA